MVGFSHDSFPITISGCSDETIFRSCAGFLLVFMDYQLSMTIRPGRSFRLAVSCCGIDLVGDEVAFGKLKLISDSGLRCSLPLSCGKELDTSKIVVSNMLVDMFGTPH